MSPRDAVQLAGYIQAHFPSQPMSEHTPDALAEVLAPYPPMDCRTAVLNLSTRTGEGARWCAPSDVAREVKRIRAKRIAEAGDLNPPPNLTDSEERVWLGAARKRIADGQEVRDDEGRELVQRSLPELRALIQRGPSKPAPAPLLEPSDHTREPEPEPTQEASA